MFEPGKRYPFGPEDYKPIAIQLWPAVPGEPDYSRGRLFIAPPCDWEFWLMDGRKVNFSYSRYGFFGGCSREPDPELPEPFEL